ncbi:MAG: manganese efflux pump [Lentimicrobiaceae bacterium]|nr:manganese efflux pump [Lentimicrobiaceae bacterium]
MDLITLLSISVALSMDAFSVSICKGLATKKFSIKTALLCAFWFGSFQALMPLIGFFLGSQFEHFITNIDHWIAFALLSFIGINMIREALGEDETTNVGQQRMIDDKGTCTGFKTMLALAIATSIDALAVGVTFAFLKVNIWFSVMVIGVTTFCFSFVGVKIGNVFGSRYSKTAEIIGGTILILLGLKILVEHLFF